MLLLSDNTDNSFGEVIEKVCYVCSADLIRMYKDNPAIKQNDLHASTQKFPEITLWNRTRVEVCGNCYKCVSEGLITYKESHPDFELPKPKEF